MASGLSQPTVKHSELLSSKAHFFSLQWPLRVSIKDYKRLEISFHSLWRVLLELFICLETVTGRYFWSVLPTLCSIIVWALPTGGLPKLWSSSVPGYNAPLPPPSSCSVWTNFPTPELYCPEGGSGTKLAPFPAHGVWPSQSRAHAR